MTCNSQKYCTTLKFLNKILVNIGKPEINDLVEFVAIDRDDIIKDVNKAVISDMEDEIYDAFGKAQVGYYSRNKVKYYILSLIKGMLDDLGYQIKSVNKRVQNNNFSRNTHVHTIVLKHENDENDDDQ